MAALHYENLPPALEEQIRADRQAGHGSPYAFPDSGVLRRRPDHDRATLIRPAFVRDTDKIIHSPFYNRYADKTQVFSFYRNDDITRRGLHVQLVSRIARTIGSALGLNLDLIEAIALGHDIGHTPFGHAGERYLDAILFARTGRHFSHNIHSVRVLDGIFSYNISLQTLNGIAAHDGEMELNRYQPVPLTDFAAFDEQIEACYRDKACVRRLVPATLEGCVMRISDIIAYVGKDRQDAERAKIIRQDEFQESAIGRHNAEIINNLIVNIILHSYGRPYIQMDKIHFEALQQVKADNYSLIYRNDGINREFESTVKPMMEELFDRLLADLTEERRSSPIFGHHIDYVNQAHYRRDIPYEDTPPAQIVVDYIASMTDDYFIDLYSHLFPNSPHRIAYKGYFD